MLNVHSQKENNNLEKCSKFDWCSKNLCPLDLDLDLRSGKARDKCKYMRRDRGSVIPDELLQYVPDGNIKQLNAVSQKRHYQIAV